MSTQIENMKAKLQRLEQEFDAIFDDNPRAGHGGTPNITDNSKGRQMIRVCDKREERLRRKHAAIEDQKEKIRVAESREAYRQTPTKKSKKFIEKNPIHPGLLALSADGKLKQWERNPMYFFIPGLERVALATFDGKIAFCKRFPVKNDNERSTAQALIDAAVTYQQ